MMSGLETPNTHRRHGLKELVLGVGLYFLAHASLAAQQSQLRLELVVTQACEIEQVSREDSPASMVYRIAVHCNVPDFAIEALDASGQAANLELISVTGPIRDVAGLPAQLRATTSLPGRYVFTVSADGPPPGDGDLRFRLKV
ncbi:MAG: hypothetical protein V2I43_27860 [Parvularcula sp.]|jgi:hypothetical protein|nr:hypothetical protein [Parvularcula sp.]